MNSIKPIKQLVWVSRIITLSLVLLSSLFLIFNIVLPAINGQSIFFLFSLWFVVSNLFRNITGMNNSIIDSYFNSFVENGIVLDENMTSEEKEELKKESIEYSRPHFFATSSEFAFAMDVFVAVCLDLIVTKIFL